MKLQNPSLRKRKGFTLIELIVVIAILAILAAIAIPTFVGQLNRARQATHDANVNVLISAANVALAENGNPGTDTTWSSAGLNATGDTDFNPDNYIDPAAWPMSPFLPAATQDVYSVSITTLGVISVTPAEGDYTHP